MCRPWGQVSPDEHLKLQFEEVWHLDPHEREAVQTLFAGVLHMHDARRWQQSASVLSAACAPTPPPQAKRTGSKRQLAVSR